MVQRLEAPRSAPTARPAVAPGHAAPGHAAPTPATAELQRAIAEQPSLSHPTLVTAPLASVPELAAGTTRQAGDETDHETTGETNVPLPQSSSPMSPPVVPATPIVSDVPSPLALPSSPRLHGSLQASSSPHPQGAVAMQRSSASALPTAPRTTPLTLVTPERLAGPAALTASATRTAPGRPTAAEPATYEVDPARAGDPAVQRWMPGVAPRRPRTSIRAGRARSVAAPANEAAVDVPGSTVDMPVVPALSGAEQSSAATGSGAVPVPPPPEGVPGSMSQPPAVEVAAGSEPGGIQDDSFGTAAARPAPTAQELDELARRLYDPLAARLRAELLIDRERRGQRTDAW